MRIRKNRIAVAQAVEGGFLGIFAGIWGGAVFGVWLAERGMFPVIASMAGSGSPVLGLVMHMSISAAAGAAFGALFSGLSSEPLPATLWGLVYGFVWWVIGPLTFMPLMMGMGVQWSAAAVAATLQSLVWHLIFGGVTGTAFVALGARRLVPRPAAGT